MLAVVGFKAVGCGVILAGLCFLLGAVLLVAGLFAQQGGVASESWPSTTGTITLSKMRSKTSGGGKPSKRVSITTYETEFEYAYTVDGVDYVGSRVSPFRFQGSKESALEAIAKYPKGAEVPVYYNPERPSRSFLEPGFSWPAMIMTGIGAALMAVCFLVVALVVYAVIRIYKIKRA